MGDRVVRATSAILIPFDWTSLGDHLAEARARLLDRRLGGEGGAALWDPLGVERRARQVAELSPALRRTMGADGEVVGDHSWSGLGLTNDARQRLLPSPRLMQRQRRDLLALAHPARFGVDAWLFPLGAGVVAYHVDWVGDAEDLETADLLAALAGARAIRAESRTPGWVLASDPRSSERLLPLRADLGDAVWGALVDGAPVDLATLTNWLLRAADEPADPPPDRLALARTAVLHGAVVLASEPAEDSHDALLFRLSRGYAAHYVAPATAASDVVLAPRGNRRLAVSREGSVALSWLTDGCKEAFELDDWPSRFLGVYLALAMQVHSERLTLSRLALAAAEAVRERERVRQRGASLEAVAERRDALRSLHDQLVTACLGLASDDPGGPTDYADYYHAVRTVHRISDQREQLRRGIESVVGLVEADFEEISEALQRDEACRERAEAEIGRAHV